MQRCVSFVAFKTKGLSGNSMGKERKSKRSCSQKITCGTNHYCHHNYNLKTISTPSSLSSSSSNLSKSFQHRNKFALYNKRTFLGVFFFFVFSFFVCFFSHKFVYLLVDFDPSFLVIYFASGSIAYY